MTIKTLTRNSWSRITRKPEDDTGGEAPMSTFAGAPAAAADTTGGQTDAGTQSEASTAGDAGADTLVGDAGADTLVGGETAPGNTDAGQSDSSAAGDDKLVITGAPGADEVYAIKVPDGMVFDDAALALASPILRELDISQAGAQALVEKLYVPLMQMGAERSAKEATEHFDAERAKWLTEAKADPRFKELGGWDKSLTLAAKARDHFGGAALNELFDDSGLGNRADVIEAFAKIGKALSEDDFHRSDSSAPQPVSAKAAFYGDTMDRAAS